MVATDVRAAGCSARVRRHRRAPPRRRPRRPALSTGVAPVEASRRAPRPRPCGATSKPESATPLARPRAGPAAQLHMACGTAKMLVALRVTEQTVPSASHVAAERGRTPHPNQPPRVTTRDGASHHHQRAPDRRPPCRRPHTPLPPAGAATSHRYTSSGQPVAARCRSSHRTAPIGWHWGPTVHSGPLGGLHRDPQSCGSRPDRTGGDHNRDTAERWPAAPGRRHDPANPARRRARGPE